MTDVMMRLPVRASATTEQATRLVPATWAVSGKSPDLSKVTKGRPA